MQPIWRNRLEHDMFWRGWVANQPAYWTPPSFYEIVPWRWVEFRFAVAFLWGRP